MNAPSYVSIVELAPIIHVGGPMQRLMAIIRSYFDASFTKVSGVTTIGGYLGTEEEWTKIERAWIENLELWELKEFHLAELLAGETHLGRENGELCALSFARILGNSNLHNIGASVAVDDWSVRLKNLSKDFPEPYHFCFRMLLGELIVHMMTEFPNDLVAIIADADTAKLDAAKAIFDKIDEFNNGYLASLTFASRHRFRLLQCADLYAGEERKAWLSSQSWMHPDVNRLYGFSMTGQGRFAYWSEAVQQGFDEINKRSGKIAITPISTRTIGGKKLLKR